MYIHTKSLLLFLLYKWSYPEDVQKKKNKSLVQNCFLINPRQALCYPESLHACAIILCYFSLLLPDQILSLEHSPAFQG